MNKNIKLIKKFRRQDHNFSTRLPFANKKIREIWKIMVNTIFNSTDDMIEKLQQIKGKTKSKFKKNLSNFYDKVNIKNFRLEEDPFSTNAQGVSKTFHEILLLKNFLQTEPQVKNMNINYYDLFYIPIKNRDDKEIVGDQYEDN